MSDDYTPDEIDAIELLRMWIARHYPDRRAEQRHGAGMVSISWFVSGADGTIEVAPFQAHDHGVGDFLTAFTWPVHANTGQPVNWLSLPVADGQWTTRRADKGGFLQQATGWNRHHCSQWCTYLDFSGQCPTWTDFSRRRLDRAGDEACEQARAIATIITLGRTGVS